MFYKHLDPFILCLGCMKVHQVTWYAENPDFMNFNTLSQFDSGYDIRKVQYSKKLKAKKGKKYVRSFFYI